MKEETINRKILSKRRHKNRRIIKKVQKKKILNKGRQQKKEVTKDKKNGKIERITKE